MLVGAAQQMHAAYVIGKEKVVDKVSAVKDVASRALSSVGAFFESSVHNIYEAFAKKKSVASTQKPLKHRDFYNVTRYLPSRKELLQKAEGRTKEIGELCGQLKSGRWEDIIKSYRAHPDHLAVDGLKAFQQGLITMEQFTTLIFCWSVMNDFPGKEIQVRPLFEENGSVNESARAAFLQTITSYGDLRIPNDVAACDNFLEKMRLQPVSERIFFLVDKEPYDLSNRIERASQGSMTIMDTVSMGVGFNVCHQVKEGDRTYRMVPSLSMMQQFLNSYSLTAHAVAIAPVIGLSTTEDIANNIVNNDRDMGLPFPGVALPEQADSFLVKCAMDFIGHDFYHSYRVSRTLCSLRPAYKELADVVERVQKGYRGQEERVSRFLQKLYERIIDMENPFLEYDDVVTNWMKKTLNVEHIQDGHRIVFGWEFCVYMSINRMINRADSNLLQQEEKKKFEEAILLSGVKGEIVRALYNSGFFGRYSITEKILKEMLRFDNVQAKELLAKLLDEVEDDLTLVDAVTFDNVLMTRFDYMHKMLSPEIKDKNYFARLAIPLIKPCKKKSSLRMTW